MMHRLIAIGKPRDDDLGVRKHNKRTRIRESLNKLRCQRPDDFYDNYDTPRVTSLSREWEQDTATEDEEFSDRYSITVMHTHKAPKVTFGDDTSGRSFSPVAPLLPHKQREAFDRDDSTIYDDETVSLVDTLQTDWETVEGRFPRVDDNISHEGDYTLGYDESTAPSMSTRQYYTKGVVGEVVEVFDDFTYFFRCLNVEAQKQIVASMRCGR